MRRPYLYQTLVCEWRLGRMLDGIGPSNGFSARGRAALQTLVCEWRLGKMLDGIGPNNGSCAPAGVRNMVRLARSAILGGRSAG